MPTPAVPAPPVPPSTEVAPKANLSPVLTGSGTSDDTHADSDPNGLFFNEQAYCAVLLSEEDGIWMVSTPDPNKIDPSPPSAPTTEPVLPDDLAPAPENQEPVLIEMMWYTSVNATNNPPSSEESLGSVSLDGACIVLLPVPPPCATNVMTSFT